LYVRTLWADEYNRTERTLHVRTLAQATLLSGWC